MPHKGYEGRMSYINNAGSTPGQGAKRYLTPMKEISVPNVVIAEVEDMKTPANLGDPRQVMPMRGTQKGGG